MKQLIRHILREHIHNLNEGAKLTQDDFIKKMKEVHGKKYDFSKSNYIGSETKVEVICPIHGSFYKTPYNLMKGSGCQKCSGKAKGSTEDFIKKAIEVHGDRYDYSKVDYKNNSTKVRIICPVHGEFLQAPTNHLLSGQGCPKCGGTGKFSKNDFIVKAKEKHGNKFDYSKVKYANFNEPVTIICPTHGKFSQSPKSHISSNGCQKCGLEIRDNKLRGNVDDFIEKAEKIHGDKFNYSKVVYQKSNEPVKIICSTHGVFEMSPNAHLGGYGCPKCAGKNMDTKEFIRRAKEVHGDKFGYNKSKYISSIEELMIKCQIHGYFSQPAGRHLSGAGCPKCANKNVTTDEFIEKAMHVHGNTYDYSKSKYIPGKKIEIICKEHGPFIMDPRAHVNQGQGCPRCKESKGEKLVSSILDKLKIKYIPQKTYTDCINVSEKGRCTVLKFDFYIPRLNTIIEYDGEGHFMPIRKSVKDIEPQIKRDRIKNNYCKDKGIKLIRIPYTIKFSEVAKTIEDALKSNKKFILCGDYPKKGWNSLPE